MTTKILTVTVNTAIDQVIKVEGLGQSDNLQATSSCEFAAGKGVNVAKTLESLECPVMALGFVGRDSFSLFRQLNSAYLHTDFIGVAGKTRTNLTLIDTVHSKELHVRTPGYCVTTEQCMQLLNRIQQQANKNDIVILSGSLPKGAPADFYRQLIEVCHAKSARALLDSSGQALRLGITAKPFLIKPNRDELAELIGRPISTEADLMTAARSAIDQGVQWVVVSKGADGIVSLDHTQTISLETPPSISSSLCTVGCGDALVGGIAYALLNEYEPLATLTFGVTCATANLGSIEPGRIRIGKVG